MGTLETVHTTANKAWERLPDHTALQLHKTRAIVFVVFLAFHLLKQINNVPDKCQPLSCPGTCPFVFSRVSRVIFVGLWYVSCVFMLMFGILFKVMLFCKKAVCSNNWDSLCFRWIRFGQVYFDQLSVPDRPVFLRISWTFTSNQKNCTGTFTQIKVIWAEMFAYLHPCLSHTCIISMCLLKFKVWIKYLMAHLCR